MTRTRLTRRNLLIAGSAVLATPYLSSRPARAAGQVVIRNPGGAWSDTQKKYIYEPFTKETGIEVVIVPTTLTKMLAMVKSGNNELDVADAGYDGLVELDKAKALAPIDYAAWKYAKPDEIPEEYWDTKKFPGARMLQDMAAGTPNLEFALIADGVPMDKVYPIDIERGFKSMSRIKPYIKKFWDTGALSAQMLADRDVVLGSIWNGRLQAIADKGAPVAIDWTQHMLSIQAYGIFKDAKNLKNAQLYVDYAMQAKAQVGMPKELNYGPTSIEAFDMLTAAQKANLPGSPENMKRCFIQDVNWWSDNRAKVNATWSKWILT